MPEITKDEVFRDKELKWNGWGYKDAYFYYDYDSKKIYFTGDRFDYEISGQELPDLNPWMINRMGADENITFPAQKGMMNIPKPIICAEFIDRLNQHNIDFTLDGIKRINRGHGQTLQEVMTLRNGHLPRIPDVVVWPKGHHQVVQIVNAAKDLPVCIIPFGGGTSVSGALECPTGETRSIISLDLAKMNQIIRIDSKSMTVRAEAGIRGIELENELNEKGFTLGHEPDSMEFSTVGGWVSTRASGMKRSKYGNIEDLLVHATLVTPRGVMQKQCHVPRLSCGPDIHHFILGSEGIFGVVTEATFKIWPLPECRKYGCILFRNFEEGVAFAREVALQHCAPAAVRIVDNEQFVFGRALKPGAKSKFAKLIEHLKQVYVTKIKGFNPDEMCVGTLVFEGTNSEVKAQEQKINTLAKQFYGLPVGSDTGRYVYMLAFSITYLRDMGFQFGMLGESFETSVPWDQVLECCNRVRQLCYAEAKRLGVIHPTFASCRVSQVYDSGACIYFYFGFNHRDLTDPVEIFKKIETAARDEILACGGCISHHHGVGKLRKRWLPQTIGEVGLSTLRAVKQHLDPQNIFGSGNLFSVSTL